MPVRAIPRANKTLCQTTTNTLDNTCHEEFNFQQVFTASRGSTSLLHDIVASTFTIKAVTSALSQVHCPQNNIIAKLTFCTMTLLARRSVIVTPMTRKTLCHPFCGHLPMNCSSLMQRRRQMEKKGRRQPLNTWATRITTRRSTGGRRKVQIEVFSTITATPF